MATATTMIAAGPMITAVNHLQAAMTTVAGVHRLHREVRNGDKTLPEKEIDVVQSPPTAILFLRAQMVTSYHLVQAMLHHFADHLPLAALPHAAALAAAEETSTRTSPTTIAGTTLAEGVEMMATAAVKAAATETQMHRREATIETATMAVAEIHTVLAGTTDSAGLVVGVPSARIRDAQDFRIGRGISTAGDHTDMRVLLGQLICVS